MPGGVSMAKDATQLADSGMSEEFGLASVKALEMY